MSYQKPNLIKMIKNRRYDNYSTNFFDWLNIFIIFIGLDYFL